MSGEAFGSYRVIGTLGSGGMGVVYLAEHVLIGKRAAVKLLRPQFSQDRDVVQRFFNEARAATVIKHPGIVEVFDFGYDSTGAAYIIMEFLDGEPLATRLTRDGVLPPSLALTITRQVANAIAAAHAKGIVHRDLKPDNIFVVPHTETASGMLCKVLDFGIAKLAVPEGAQSQTRTGQMLGTPLYMSPEQCRGITQIDSRSDVYSLGCILFQMLVGRPPFLGEGIGDVISAHIHVAPPAMSSFGARVSPNVEALIQRMLAKRPDDRLGSMEEVSREIDRLLPTTSGPIAVISPPVTDLRSEPRPITTLGNAAAQITPGPASTVVTRRSRASMFAAIGVAGILVTVLAVWLGTRGGGTPAATTAAQPVSSNAPDAGAPPKAMRAGTVKVDLGAIASPVAGDVQLVVDNRVYPATSIRTVAESNETITLVVLLQGTERFMMNSGNYNAIANALDVLAKLGPPGSRAEIISYGSDVKVRWMGPLQTLSGGVLGAPKEFAGQMVPDLVAGVDQAFATLRKDGVGKRYLVIFGTGDTASDDKDVIVAERTRLERAGITTEFFLWPGDDAAKATANALVGNRVFSLATNDEVGPRAAALAAEIGGAYLADFDVDRLPTATVAATVRIRGKDIGAFHLDPSRIESRFSLSN